MELSESVQRGLRFLADPSAFDPAAFPALLEASCRSLLASRADPAVLDLPELRLIDPVLLKQTHAALVTFILEAAKLNVDRSTISSCLEDASLSAERIKTLLDSYEKHKKEIHSVLASIGRRPPLVTDASWRLQYQIKNDQVHKVNEPVYLISLNTEKAGTEEDISFSCTTEQLQDLVGKLKDAAKSVEKASQT